MTEDPWPDDETLRRAYRSILRRRYQVHRGPCPAPDELRRLVLHGVPTPERLALLDHVMGCVNCLAEFERLRE